MNKRRGATAVFSVLPDLGRNYPIWAGAIVIGVVAYALGYGSHMTFGFFNAMRARFVWWPFVSLPAGGMALTWFMRRVGPGTEGSGIQQAVAAVSVAKNEAQVGWLINLRLAAAKFVAIVFGLGSGFVLGLEGPTVQIGASIMYAFRRFYPNVNPAIRGQLIMAGGAAGISAAFGAPMAGLMFAFEELGKSISWHASARVMVSVILSGTVAFALRGSVVFFDHIAFFRGVTPTLLLLLLAASVAGALFGSAFAWLAIRTERWMPKRLLSLRQRRPYLFMVACALVIACLGTVSPVFGSGVEETGAVLRGEAVFAWHYAPCKLAGLLVTLLTGVPGGVFAPSLALGAGVGSWFSGLGDPAWAGNVVAIGMVACLAAVTRAPLTAAIIIAEMTGSHSIILLVMAASLVSAHVSRYTHVRFYHDLARRALKTVPRPLRVSGRFSRRMSRRMSRRLPPPAREGEP